MKIPGTEDADLFYASFTNDGTIWFTANLQERGLGGEDIWFSQFENGQYIDPINAGENVNSPRGEFNGAISRDGSFLIYTTTGRTPVNSGDLWIAFRNAGGAFEPAKNMGNLVNTESLEYCPSFSPDGNILFYTSRRPLLGTAINKLADLHKIHNSCGNGQSDIYWMRFNPENYRY